MRKQNFIRHLLCAMAFFLFSCKKGNLDSNSFQNPTNEKLIAKIKLWLEEQKNGLPVSDTIKIGSLKGNLEYNKLRLERYRDLEDFIVVPISSEFKSKNNKDKNPINYLVLVLKNQDSIERGNIVQYISSNSKQTAPQNTFYKIFTNQYLDCSGLFTILSITDNFRCELKFEDGKLKSMTESRSKAGSGSGRSNDTCTDWYLVTTYYYEDGTSSTTEQYMFTTCDCHETRIANGRNFQIECRSGGGGNGIGECINTISGSVSSETVNISTTNDDGLTRTKSYNWTFFKSNGNIWRFNSIEVGVHKKVNNEWRWDSFTHGGISREGVVIGGDVQCTSHVGVPTLGIYNSAMTLNYNIQYSIVCAGFPITTNHNFVTTKYFNVND